MKAAIADGTGRYSLEQVDLLPLGPRDVRVRTTLALACVTDVHARKNGKSPGLAKPHIRGHAAIGEVVEIGSMVRRTQVGDRVVVVSRPQCGECWWCLHGQPYECDTTVAPPPPVARRSDGELLQASARIGSYAEEMRLAEATVVPVHSDISDEELLMFSCGATTGFGAAFNTVKVKQSDTVAIFGAGIIGLSIAQAARYAGAAHVVMVEPIAARRDYALATSWATHAVADAEEAKALLAELTDGRGADIAYEAVGGPEALEQAFAVTRRAGDVVGIGLGHWDDVLTLPYNQVTLRNKRLSGCQFGSSDITRDIPDWVRLVEQGRLDVKPLIGEVFSLDQINEALDRQETGETLGAIICP